jgi:cell wall-associated NlpC family hydrolase
VVALRSSSGCLTAVLAGLVALLLAVVLGVAVVEGVQGACVPAEAATVSQPAAASAADSIPANYLALYQQVGPQYGLPWTVLAGIGEVESDHGRSNEPGVHSGANYAGAEGPMQFLPETFRQYGSGDIYNPADAIPATARMLKANGAPGNMRGAIFAYNHLQSYVDAVLGWAAKYGNGKYSVGGDNNRPSVCVGGGGSATMGSPNGTLGERIVYWASTQMGIVYQFGGGGPSGPNVGTNSRGDGKPGWDCSGIAEFAVYRATGGRVDLPHNTVAQYDDTSQVTHVDKSQLQPGDLVFFYTSMDHMGIYIGGGQMIEAPHTGDVVKVAPVTVDPLVAAARVIGS